jgi:hypothetical protein
MTREKFKASDIVAALQKSRGMVYVAARQLGCAANTIYNYAKKYPSVQAAIDEQRGIMIDIAEIALWNALQNGEAWAVSLTLKTLGKSRGYIERQELTGADGEALAAPVVYLPAVDHDADG